MSKIFENKKIIVGVTGSIAAYKSALFVRELKKLGAEVFVIMTRSATEFITSLTLENLSRNPVTVDMFDKNAQSGGAWHIHAANECDLMIIAPCSASTLSKIATGICDNALVTIATALPPEVPLIIAPAMDSTMFLSHSIQRNIKILMEDGIHIIQPADGELSSGLTGPGRLPEIDVLVNEVSKILTPKTKMSNHINKYFNLELLKLYFENKKVLITAGPTIEKIDDVRYLTNRSSGKMGYALAEKVSNLGAEVTLISGPVKITPPANVKIINIENAEEMYEASIKAFKNSDIAILSAAVSDFTPINKSTGKIKKEDVGTELTIHLKQTKDILFELSKMKKKNQIVIGFALEHINEIENGIKKLQRKKCDLIVLNSMSKENSGFDIDLNTITILDAKGVIKDYPTMNKSECAMVILESIRNY
jgi:phosphopantothenoylcysteine decarboxylase/phosphopantothenate--cysteine ligase